MDKHTVDRFKETMTKKLLESYMDGQNDCIDNLILSFKEYPGTYATFNDLIDQFKKVKETINKEHKGD
ncbi:MAG: hypothetical protein GY834_10765 [Bacteroidetes bacterium]|nr:hypothetical protein [Bacteroidota bacterium]